jgi:hypothetical protein
MARKEKEAMAAFFKAAASAASHTKLIAERSERVRDRNL